MAENQSPYQGGNQAPRFRGADQYQQVVTYGLLVWQAIMGLGLLVLVFYLVTR